MKDILRLLIAVLIMPASFLVVADESVNSNENNDVRVEEEEAEVQVEDNEDDDADVDMVEAEDESGSFLDNLSAAQIAGI